MEPYRPQYNRCRDWSFYAQDDFKVTPRLTLMYGLRYEYNGPAYTLNDNIFSFDLATGKIVVPERRGARFISPLFPRPFRSRRPTSSGTGRSPAQAGQEQLRAALRLLLPARTAAAGP